MLGSHSTSLNVAGSLSDAANGVRTLDAVADRAKNAASSTIDSGKDAVNDVQSAIDDAFVRTARFIELTPFCGVMCQYLVISACFASPALQFPACIAHETDNVKRRVPHVSIGKSAREGFTCRFASSWSR